VIPERIIFVSRGITVFEIFHTLRVILMYQELYWGWLPSDFHYLSFLEVLSTIYGISKIEFGNNLKVKLKKQHTAVVFINNS
jgi:hypothetical protein